MGNEHPGPARLADCPLLEGTLTTGTAIAAVAPVAVLFALVTSGRVAARTAALVVAALCLVLGATVFGAGAEVLGVALAKGLWLGFWILAVVWPAMLLYRFASAAGLDRIGEALGALFPDPRVKLLVLAWVLPSFVQGVAGFGTPIVLAAPLLVAAGWAPARAVIYPLIGYHWAVTFGSMGSSFYVAALTAELGPDATSAFARDTAVLLGANALVSGALILLLDGGLPALWQGARLLLSAGPAMGATLYFVAPVVPAVASVAAGTAGLLVASGVAAIDRMIAPAPPAAAHVTGHSFRYPGESSNPAGAAEDNGDGRRAAWVLAPYGYLVITALAALLVPASRQWISSHAVVGPAFPATATALGVRNEAVDPYTPLEVFGHPGTYLLAACALGYLTYRAAGMWPRPGAKRLAGDWLRSVRSFSVSILALACVATVMRDSGMMVTLARTLVNATGGAYTSFSALVGATGSFLTGSAASSNALFAALQTRAAGFIDVPAPVLLAAQAAGANVGNIVAPVVVLIGLGAVGAQRQLARVVRTVLPVALLLLAVVTALTVLLATQFPPS